MPYLTARGLKGLRQYQYKAGGYTWLDDLHQPFWNGLTELLPKWVAPNLITLTGTLGLVAAYLIFLAYLPELQGDAPRWVYAAAGTAVLTYLHLDCIDGKQARRTKSSSPLGQLFDHGCDALSVHLIVTNSAAAMGGGLTWRSAAFALGVMGPWATAHWEEYHSGVMLYGTGGWGVTEANYLVALGFYLVAGFGPRIPYQPALRSLLPARLLARPQLQHELLQRLIGLSFGDWVLLLVGYGGIHLSLSTSWRTFRSKRIRVPPKERGHKQLGRPAALWHLLQLQAFFTLGIATMLAPAVSVWHARLLIASYGLAYTLEMSKLIVSHMSKEPFRLSLWPAASLALTLANSHFRTLPPLPLAAAVTAVLLAGYLHYVFNVVDEICVYLGIKCLTIPPVPED